MTLQTPDNQYQGVNAHLHSLFQAGTDGVQWRSFHAMYVALLTVHLNGLLPRRYRAFEENALQIWIEPPVNEPYSQRRYPDVSVIRTTPSQSGFIVAAPFAESLTWETTIEETLPAFDEEINAAVIYRVDGDTRRLVLRIELLSPANKVGGSYHKLYEYSRYETLTGGIPLLEIDYLHETHSPIRTMPRYPHHARAYPYHITLSDPRLPPNQKTVRSVGFRVNQPIPRLVVPLEERDTVAMAFGEVYRDTFLHGRWGDDVDYAVEPPRMETYREDDQATIRAVMGEVQARFAP